MMEGCGQSTGSRPSGWMVETARGQDCGEMKARTHGQIKGDLESQAETFRQNVVGLGSRCVF